MVAVAEFDNVAKTYRTGLLRRRAVPALRGVSFTVEPGQVFGLLGPNRAGKTTLIKILLSLCRANSGSAARLGSPLHDRRTLARVGYMHENQAFPRYLTATHLLECYGALTLMDQPTVQRRSQELLKRVGLADRADEPISQFSKGMSQRLALAQALLNDPELLVMDEPTEGLDLGGRQMLREVIGELRSTGRTVLLVSHVLTEVEQLCDRVAVIVNGRLAHQGPLSDLLQDPQSGATRSLEEALQRVYDRAGA